MGSNPLGRRLLLNKSHKSFTKSYGNTKSYRSMTLVTISPRQQLQIFHISWGPLVQMASTSGLWPVKAGSNPTRSTFHVLKFLCKIFQQTETNTLDSLEYFFFWGGVQNTRLEYKRSALCHCSRGFFMKRLRRSQDATNVGFMKLRIE